MWWSAWRLVGKQPEKVVAEGATSLIAFVAMTEKGLYSFEQIVYGPYASKKEAEETDIPPPKNSA